MFEFPAVPYPPLEKLGLIGDRRTAALIAADGTLCWMCLPNFDGVPLFGSLLDSRKGGSWTFGPRNRVFGRQRYASAGPILLTVWENADYAVELCDFMPWPQNSRKPADEPRRVVLRRLRCLRGTAPVRLALRASNDFKSAINVKQISSCSAAFDYEQAPVFWSSNTFAADADKIESEFVLGAGEEIWCAFGWGQDSLRDRWTDESAKAALQETENYWRRWIDRIDYRGPHRSGILRSAMLVHLLTFAPTGAVVASPTCSLPERIGGDRNYDYRYSWIRDASLGLDLLVKLGMTEDAKRSLDWIASLEATDGAPLQVLYRIDGRPLGPVVERTDVAGYRRSQPVRTGNAAASMREIDSFGYLADCLLAYMRHGGEWDPRYWDMIARLADFTARHWRRPNSSIWELRPERQFVASKIMSIVTLDRALAIAERANKANVAPAGWKHARSEIFAEMMSCGWSERLNAFRQHYDADKVDAASLLVSIMDVLPADHSYVRNNVESLVERLDVNGLLHRFIDSDASEHFWIAGDEEGAFLMCSFWLAQILAQRNDVDRAEAILRRTERTAGELGLFAESVDARNDTFLGNTPLLFSQVEYARAAMAVDRALATKSVVL
jgi:GH15 family glucan-1,4-alpha-glucosidase